MFNQEYYNLIYQVCLTYNPRLEKLYAPLKDEQPTLIRRVLAALRSISLWTGHALATSKA